MRNKKEYIYPAIYQDINAKDLISLMPSDLNQAFAFWIKESEADFSINDFKRPIYKVSCIFYCDLKNIAPTQNWKLVKSNIRQDILEVFRTHQFAGIGVLQILSIVDDDITEVYKGFSVDQLDNKYKIYPKYAIRLNFDFTFLMECINGSYNSYS